MVKQSKSASLALYVSVWIGIIIVASLLYGNQLLTKTDQVVQLLTNDPVNAVKALLESAFKNDIFLIILGLGVTGIIGSLLTGNNFIVIYIVPIVMIFALAELFALPTALITDEFAGNTTSSILTGINISTGTPTSTEGSIKVVQTIFLLFLGGLTILTIYSFISGRN